MATISECQQSIRLSSRYSLSFPSKRTSNTTKSILLKVGKLRLKEVQPIATITESVNKRAVIWTMDCSTSTSVFFLFHFTTSVHIVTLRCGALSYFSSFITNMQSKQKRMRGEIRLRINTVIIKKKEGEENSQAVAKQTPKQSRGFQGSNFL